MDGPTARTVATSIVLLTTAAVLARALVHGTTPTTGISERSRSKRTSGKVSNRSRRTHEADVTPQYVTGLVNVGNTCFMNAVLQALASLPSLRAYLEARKEIGHAQDSITLALCETIEMLNTIQRRPTAKRLVKMVSTVKAKAAHVLTSQQQDAQELFQILSSQLSEEREKLDYPGTLSLFDSMTFSDILNPLPSPLSSSSSATGGVGARRKSTSSVMSASLSLSQVNLASREGKLSAARGNKDAPSSPSSDSDHLNFTGRADSGSSEGGEAMTMTTSVILDRHEQDKFSRAKSPFMGLLASRVSCVDCGYTAAIRHSTFDNLSLTVPLQYSCSLEDCLDAFIHLDTIVDFNCRKCTVMSASKDVELKIEQGKKALEESMKKNQDRKVNGKHNDQNQETSKVALPAEGLNADQIQEHHGNGDIDATTALKETRKSKRRSSNEASETSKMRLAELEQLKRGIDQCLMSDIEMDLSPLELTPVCSKRTTKHSMIAKPPQALCLHLNRSMFTASGQTAKNPCKVLFGPRLDFTRFTTSGYLTTVATKSMSRRGSITGGVAGAAAGHGSSMIDAGLGLGTGMGVFSQRHENIRRASLSSSWCAAQPHNAEANGRKEAEVDAEKDEDEEDRVFYQLWAVIVHLGSHNSGHFVTYRRIPSSSASSSSSPSSNGDMNPRSLPLSSPPSDKWWRISDEDVQIVDWALVKNVEAYMMFFEKEV